MNFWQGPHVRLRAVEPSDAEFFFTWNLDSEVARNLDWVWPPTSRELVKHQMEEMALRKLVDDAFFWVIENEAGEPIGCINSHHCDRRVGTFQYGVAIRSEHQRKGYAREAILLVLRYFFEELRYQKAMVSINSDNVASLRLHERLGFQLEGCLRRTAFTRGQYLDEVLMGITVEEFQAL